jgi:hypothetical protein
MDAEAKRVIRLVFLDLLPKTMDPDTRENLVKCIEDGGCQASAVYEAAIYAGWCRGYAEGDGAHRGKRRWPEGAGSVEEGRRQYEAVMAEEREARRREPKLCKTCSGRGKVGEPSPFEGSGLPDDVETYQAMARAGVLERNCPACGGSGYARSACPKCGKSMDNDTLICCNQCDKDAEHLR